MPKQLLVGAHMSIANGFHNALYEGAKIGASTIQIFTSNQKQWKGKKISDKDIDLWKKALKETKITTVMSHDSYLINLGSPKKDMLLKSRQAFKEEIERCLLLDIDYLNFHPGSALDSTEEQCLDSIVESLLEVSPLLKDKKLKLLLETTAGQGSNVGYCFEHLDYIIKKVESKVPIGVCIDTCHSFAAGYDLRTKKACDETLKEFDKIVGLHHLFAFHVNDSMQPLGSRKDRHAPLGEGEIGLECFKFLMTDKRVKYLPKYLETPFSEKNWKNEIALLKKLAEGKK